jgi:hypothetical protein
LSARGRRQLVDTLEVPAQTLWRWQQWWREVFAEGPWWRLERAQFIPPIAAARLPGALLARLGGAGLSQRLVRLLWLIGPVTTPSWSGSLTVAPDPQNL